MAALAPIPPRDQELYSMLLHQSSIFTMVDLHELGERLELPAPSENCPRRNLVEHLLVHTRHCPYKRSLLEQLACRKKILKNRKRKARAADIANQKKETWQRQKPYIAAASQLLIHKEDHLLLLYRLESNEAKLALAQASDMTPVIPLTFVGYLEKTEGSQVQFCPASADAPTLWHKLVCRGGNHAGYVWTPDIDKVHHKRKREDSSHRIKVVNDVLDASALGCVAALANRMDVQRVPDSLLRMFD